MDISSGTVTLTLTVNASDTSGVITPTGGPYTYFNGTQFTGTTWTLTNGDVYDGVYTSYLALNPTVIGPGSLTMQVAPWYFKDTNNYQSDGTDNINVSVVNFSGTAPPSTGNGSSSSPYQIDSFSDLWWISQDSSRWAYHYIQTADIDASTSINLDYGKGFTPIGNITTKFTGSYDGQSYYIDNLHISRPQGTEIGLFGYANFATVKNINLFQPNITGDIRVGSIVGELINSSGQFIGNHVFEGFVKGNTTTGGLVGRLGNNSHIHASSYTGTTTGYTSSQNFTGGGDPINIGGIVGKMKPGSVIRTSFFEGYVFGVRFVGGIVGVNSGSEISDSYSIGTITAEDSIIGGITGNSDYDNNDTGRVHNFTSSIITILSNSSFVGPVVGAQSSAYEGADNFWNSDITNLTSAGGSIDFPKTTQQLKTKSTFTDEGWDFNNTWIITGNLNNGLPALKGNNEIGLVDFEFNEQSLSGTLTFLEPLYSDSSSSSSLQASDVLISIYDPENTVSTTSSNPLNFEVSSDSKAFSFSASITGNLTGNEEFRIAPSGSTSIYDSSGSTVDDDIYLSCNLTNDNAAPQLISLSSNYTDNKINSGDTVIITANFNESMSATPTIQLSTNSQTALVMSPSSFGVEALDANNSNTNAGAGGTDQWQSFTASKTGQLSKIAWKMACPVINGAPQPISFKIYQGEGITGTLLASSLNLYTPSYNDSNGNYISGEYVYFDITSNNISVAPGSKYTIRLTLTDESQNVGFLDLSSQNSYSGGRGSNDSDWDYAFKTYIRPFSNGSENWTYTGVISSTTELSVSATVSGTDLSNNSYSETNSITLKFGITTDLLKPTLLLTSTSTFGATQISNSGNVTITASFSESVTKTIIKIRKGSNVESYNMIPSIDFNFSDHWLLSTSGNTQEPNNSGGGENLAYMGIVNSSSHPNYNQLVFTDYGEGQDQLQLFIETTEQVHELVGMIKVGSFNGSNYFISSNKYNYTSQMDLVLNRLNAELVSIETQEEYDYLTLLCRNNSTVRSQEPFFIGLYQDTNSSEYSEPSGGWKWKNDDTFNKWEYVWQVTSTLDSDQVSVTIEAEDKSGNAYSGTDSLTFNVLDLPDYLPSNGLVAWYPFNGNSNDESGNSKHGTVLNGPQLTTDRNGNAQSAYDFDWDGITGYGSDWKRIDLDHDFNLGSTFTFNVWINPETYYWTGNNSKSSVIIANNADCNSNNFRINLDGENGLITSSGTSGFGFQGEVSNQADLNQWQMISVISDGSNAKIYRNGNEIASSSSASYQIMGCLAIGLHRQSNGHWYYFDGKIDDVGIWNRALTETEVQGLLTGGIDASTTTVSLTSSDTDQVVAENTVVSLTASFSQPMESSPTISIIATNTQSNASLALVSGVAMSSTSSASVWTYQWTVNTTNTLENVSITVSGTTTSGSLYSDTTSLTFTIDNDNPGISDLQYKSNTQEVEVIFNEPVFSQENGSFTGPLSSENFSFSLSNGTALLGNTSPLSISASGTTFTLGVDLSGFISGTEILSVIPTANSIYDIAGNPISTLGNGFSVNLIDNINPSIAALDLTNDNSSVILTFSEEVFSSSASSFDSSTASNTVYSIPTQQTQTSSWSPWIYNFDLNVPEGYFVSKITFDFDAVDQGWGGTNANATVKINSTELGKAQLTHSVNSFSLSKTDTFQDFNYNGPNELKFYFIGWSGWSSTTTNGQLTVYYSPLNIEAADFELGISGGTATLASNTPTSISSNGNNYMLGLNLNGTADGSEILTINVVSNEIYDSAGNAAASSISSITLLDNVASTISSTILSNTNTGVIVQFTEPLGSFSNWSPNEPNNINGGEHYGELEPTRKFNDVTGIGVYESLIELDYITNSITNYTFKGSFRGHSYFISNTINNFANSKLNAEQVGGYLAVIKSEAELNFIIENTTNTARYIGLFQDVNDETYNEPSGGWKWLDGTYAATTGFNLNAVNLSVSGGTASLTKTTPISVVEMSNNRYLLELPIQGEVSGNEMITVGINSNVIYDAADNIISSTQVNNTVQLQDTSKPNVVLSDDRSKEIFKGGDIIEITATFNEDMAAYPSVSFSNLNSSFQMSATNSASIWTYNWTVTDTLNETVNVSVEGQDLLGNTYTGTDTLSYVVDNTLPIIIFSDDQTDSYLRSADTVIIEATFSETLGSTPTLTLSDGNLNNTVAMSGPSSNNTWSFTWSVGAADWSDGPVSIQIQEAEDQGGNSYSGVASLTYTIDNTAPTLQLSSNSISGVVKSGDEIIFEALISEALTNPPVLSFGDAFSTQLMSQTITPTIWTFSWNVPEAIDGLYSSTATVTDNAGNNQSQTNTLTFSIDNTAPVISELDLFPDNTAVEVTFDDTVFSLYSSNVASGNLEPSDFELGISGGEATLLSSIPESISVNRTAYTLFFTTEGSATGSETLTITINSSAIFDWVGNPSISNQVTSTVLLNDITAPFIREAQVIDDKTLTLTLNELAFSSDGSPIEATDLSLSLSTGSATLKSQTPEGLEQEETTYTISFTITGTISEGQTISIGLVNPIQDAVGNATSTFNINHVLELIPDSDQDGIPDDIDACPETPEGEPVNANGCSLSQLDDDQDGINNALDVCPGTPAGETVNENGCSDLQNDLDQDGVENDLDQCPDTEAGTGVNANGCAQIQIDEDLDGVLNADDQCPGSEPGVRVNEFGCARVQNDKDLDGVLDDGDLCPKTAQGESVDEFGCSLIQNLIKKDGDLDGVLNEDDLCPNTPLGTIVDDTGCSQQDLDILEENKDDDGDGVPNILDRCNDTPSDTEVDLNGCTLAELEAVADLDKDFDGVPDDIDSCLETERGLLVNEFGCSLSQIDTDFDRVMDDVDLCPDTPLNVQVDEFGCSDSQLENDLDLDGVINEDDLCAATPMGEAVNEFGCSEIQLELDTDLDGVLDENDACLNTEFGLEVNDEGCSEGQLDDDGDGVDNQFDRCPETLAGVEVDDNGCSEDQLDLDDDGDGVKNRKDLCAGTPIDTPIDENGCPFNPPVIYSAEFERIETKSVNMDNPVDVPLGKIIAFDDNPTTNDLTDEVTLKLEDVGNSDYFRLEGDLLYLIKSIDYEEQKTLSVTIKATNNRELSSTSIMKLNVLDIPNTYTFSSYTLAVFPVDANTTADSKNSYRRYFNPNTTKGVGKWKIKKKISGGADAALFSIGSSGDQQKNSAGESEDYLEFINPPDFSNPQDHNRDNIYEVEVINVNSEDGDSDVPVVLTQTQLVVPEGNTTAIQLQTVPATPLDDTDGDGVVDILDNSPLVSNPDQSDDDGDGVGDVSDDADHDGVWNPNDTCADTPYGSMVNKEGCLIFYLAPSNFSLSKTEKCLDTNSISLVVQDTSVTYNIAVSGAINKTETLSTNNWTLNNLSAGDYSICVTVDGILDTEFKRCFDLTINEPQPLSVYSASRKGQETVNYKLAGGSSYSITHNGITKQTTQNNYTLTLDKGVNTVSISTGIACQGIFEQSYFNSDTVVTAPNPFNDMLAIYVGGEEMDASIELYSNDGRIITSQHYSLTIMDRTLYIDTSDLITGSYVVKVTNASVNQSQIVIKE